MSARVEFTGKGFVGTVSVTRNDDGQWSMSIHTHTGKHRHFQLVAFIQDCRGQRPSLDPGDSTSGPVLWLGTASIDVPERLAPKLQTFLAEHAIGGAA